MFQFLSLFTRLIANNWKKILVALALAAVAVVLLSTGIFSPLGLPILATGISIALGVSLSAMALAVLGITYKKQAILDYCEQKISQEDGLLFMNVEEKLKKARADQQRKQEEEIEKAQRQEEQRQEAQRQKAARQAERQDEVFPGSIFRHYASQEFYEHSPMRTSHDVKWKEFIDKLAVCVTNDSTIDSDERLKVIAHEMKKATAHGSLDLRFPEYMREHRQNAGNVVMTTKNASSTVSADIENKAVQGYSQEILEQLGDLKVVQAIRKNSHGETVGRGLYGGFCPSDTTDRYKAVLHHVAQKTGLDSSDIQEIVSHQEAKNNPLAYSIYDVGFLAKTFRPTESYVRELSKKTLAEKVKQFFANTLIGNKYKAVQKDAESLKLAVSNTYEWNLDKSSYDADNIVSVMGRSPCSVNNVTYQTECRSILACLSPNDYVYAHEFYCGILATLAKSCASPQQFLQILQTRNKKIVANLLAGDHEQLLEKYVAQGGSNEEIYEKLKQDLQINIHQFVKHYLGIAGDTIQEILNLQQTQIQQQADENETCWAGNKQQIIDKIKRYRGDSVADNTGTSSIDWSFRRSKLKELAALCPIAVGEQLEEPILAADLQIYEKKSLQLWFSNSEKSPMTRESIAYKNVYEYKALKPFLHQYAKEKGNQGKVSPQLINSLLTLGCDPLTGKLMKDPVICNGLLNDKVIPLICDISTYERLRQQGKLVNSTKKHFSELASVLNVFSVELNAQLSPSQHTVNNAQLNSNYAKHLAAINNGSAASLKKIDSLKTRQRSSYGVSSSGNQRRQSSSMQVSPTSSANLRRSNTNTKTSTKG